MFGHFPGLCGSSLFSVAAAASKHLREGKPSALGSDLRSSYWFSVGNVGISLGYVGITETRMEATTL